MILRRPLPAGLPPGRRSGPPPGRAAAGVWARGAADRRAARDGIVTAILSRFTGIAIAAIVAAHLVFGIDDDPLPMRALLAVPAVLLILEARNYLRSQERQFPFIVLALLQYYVAFGFPVFFDTPFYDLNGRVLFTDSTRIAGSAAVALGSLCLLGAARTALRFGGDLRSLALKVLPPDTIPARWDDAFLVYGAVSVLMAVAATFFPTAIPSSVAVAVFTVFPLELALGLATMRPPKRLGSLASQICFGVGAMAGVLRGQLDPVARIGASFVAAEWVVKRKVALGFITAMAVAFLVLQPAKRSYREQVWGHSAKTGEELGVTSRVTAWETSIVGRFFNDGATRTDDGDTAVARLTELEPVLQAIDVVPHRIDYAYGQSLVQILYAPIPRLIWPDKPTTRDEISQRYAIIFGRQTERAAETTAVGMSVLVEGYWNFGWIGIGLSTIAMGLVVGAWQRVFSGDHWALGAIGVAQIASMPSNAPMVLLYSTLFQTSAGRFIAIWVVYWGASIMSRKAVRRQAIPARRLAG